MERATPTTRPITEIVGGSVAAAKLATIRTSESRMSHCYIRPKTAKINRKPCRLEIAVSQTKQTLPAQINRKLSGTSRKQLRHANSSRSSLATSRCPFHGVEQDFHVSMLVCQPFQAATILIAPDHHSSLTPTRRTCASAQKQQILRSRLNPLGLYFLASYAHFTIGRQRALVHNGRNKVAAGYNDKNRAALVGLETQS